MVPASGQGAPTTRQVAVDVAPAQVNIQVTVDSPDVAEQVAQRLQRDIPNLLSRALEPAFERAQLWGD
jgi:hypothetical protein